MKAYKTKTLLFRTITVNLPAVVVENITLSEQDGTNDVYASTKLRQVRELNAIQTEDAPVEETPPSYMDFTQWYGETIHAGYFIAITGDATLVEIGLPTTV